MAVPYYPNAALPNTNATQPAVTIRQPSTALLTIDSEDRYTDYINAASFPSSPYNFSITKTESLMPGFITRVGISEIVFPWTIPNINLKTNSIRVYWEISGQPEPLPTPIYLPYGFYSPTALAAAMQVAVRALPGNPLGAFTMQYGIGTPSFSYATNDPLTTVAFVLRQPNTPGFPFTRQIRQLYNLLGFTGRNSEPSLAATGNYTLCQAIRYVDIVCNQLTNSQAQKDQTSQSIARDMLCRVYLGSASGIQSTVQASDALFCPPGCAPTTLYVNYATPKQIQWIPNQNIPGFLQFTVYDDSGDLLDNSVILPGNEIADDPASVSDWSMTMQVSEC